MTRTEAKMRKESEKQPIKAVIFDLDGLVVDSEPLWTEARNKLLSQFDARVTAEDKLKTMGGGYREGIDYFINKYDLPMTFEEFSKQEQDILDRLYSKKLKFKPGAAELIQKLKESNIVIAIATSVPRKRLEFALKRLSLGGFDVMITGDDIKKGKPDPEIFLKAAEKLGVDPKECVVLEDSPFGVAAARAANMKAVAVYDDRYISEEEFLRRSEPDLIVNSLVKLDIQKLASLFI